MYWKTAHKHARQLSGRRRRKANTFAVRRLRTWFSALITLYRLAERRTRAICMACKHKRHFRPCKVRHGFGEIPNIGVKTCLCAVYDVPYVPPDWSKFFNGTQ